MITLTQQLTRACLALDLPIDVGFVADLGKGNQIRSVARIRNLGAKRGMLVFSAFEPIRDHADRLVEAGYGISILSEPSRDDPDDLDACLDMFSEWGWSGPADRRPDWFRAPMDEPPETDLEAE
jgi:hypothetical protein